MEILVYILRVIMMLLVTWLGIRIIGKKSIAQVTAYDLAAIMVLSTIASEPLVYKIPSKSTVGVLSVAIVTFLLGSLSLIKRFYNIDNKPSVVIENGKINKKTLKENKINLPFLFSLLRLQGYAKISEVEFAIVEPTGQLSVMPKSQERPVKPKDLKINTNYEGLALPLVIDGEIQYNNLKYAGLNTQWLNQEITKAGATKTEEIFLAELDTEGKLYVDFYDDKVKVNIES